MVDAEASQPGDGLSLYQILQTDGALPTIFTEHIRCKHKTQKATLIVCSLLNARPFMHFCDMILTIVR